MSCCAPGTEGAAEVARLAHALPSSEELLLASRLVGEGLRQSELSVPGVHCGACITAVEGALKALPAVVRARVNLSTRRVSVVWMEDMDGLRTDPQTFAAAIRATGYDTHLFSLTTEGDDALRNQLIRAVAVAGFAATNIMLLSVSVWSGAEAATRDLFHWISAFIAGPTLIYAGRFFYQSAWNALRHGRTNMDVPIALAITLSYTVSLWETLHSAEHVWFDATVSLLFFLLIGRTLDHIMRDRARSAITGLARLSPRGAMVVRPDGTRDYRPVEEIAVGEHLSISAGERIPVDCRVLSGASDVDRSIVNGDKRILAFMGRVHLYEGHHPNVVAHGVRTAVRAGCSTVVLTNAAGGLRPGMWPGQPVLIADHLNLTGRTPLLGENDDRIGPRFPDMGEAYTPRLRELARSVDPSLEEAVYCGLLGPTYETPAEVRMVGTLGGELVGMSTVLESIAAAHAGADLLAVSLVTNLAAGLADEVLAHDDVLAVAAESADRMGGLIAEIVGQL